MVATHIGVDDLYSDVDGTQTGHDTPQYNNIHIIKVKVILSSNSDQNGYNTSHDSSNTYKYIQLPSYSSE